MLLKPEKKPGCIILHVTVKGVPGGVGARRAGADLAEEGHACWYIKTFVGVG